MAGSIVLSWFYTVVRMRCVLFLHGSLHMSTIVYYKSIDWYLCKVLATGLQISTSRFAMDRFHGAVLPWILSPPPSTVTSLYRLQGMLHCSKQPEVKQRDSQTFC